MRLILFDTSLWIEFLRNGGAIKPTVLANLVTCGPVVQEVLQGLDDSRDGDAFRDAFLAIPCLEDPVPLRTFLDAAEIYRLGRRKGYTIRSTVDCLIASIAIRHSAEVWHNRDRDYTFISKYTGLKEQHFT